MNRFFDGCEHEAEVLEAALHSRWPEQADGALRAHVEQCPICSEALTVGEAMEAINGESHAVAASAVPDAARVWWRAQMQARREAVEAAGRPITAAQVLAFAAAAGLAGACFGATSTWFQAALRMVRSTVLDLPWSQLAASAMGGSEYLVWILLGLAVLILIPAGLCLSILRD
jgi:hypothetical protein